MTRREFDRRTRQNWGGPYMASDERAGYRSARLRPERPARDPDELARRAAYTARLVAPDSPWAGATARVMQLGSPFRGPLLWRHRARLASGGSR